MLFQRSCGLSPWLLSYKTSPLEPTKDTVEGRFPPPHRTFAHGPLLEWGTCQVSEANSRGHEVMHSRTQGTVTEEVDAEAFISLILCEKGFVSLLILMQCMAG